uniref:Cilia and flagella associated protein 184 n=1 Tax=Latimeria chalumnae TaxID=7897 RepID=H3APW2_LATCH
EKYTKMAETEQQLETEIGQPPNENKPPEEEKEKSVKTEGEIGPESDEADAGEKAPTDPVAEENDVTGEIASRESEDPKKEFELEEQEEKSSQDEVPQNYEETEEKIPEKEPSVPLPTSETFGEGEGVEIETLIGEPLSRENSPREEKEVEGPPMLVPGTPNRERGSLSEEREDDKEEEKAAAPAPLSREDLMERYAALLDQRETVAIQNSQLQHKLAEYFRKKKGEEVKPEMEKAVSDRDQRYLRYMVTLEELKNQYSQDSEFYQKRIEEVQSECQKKLDEVNTEWLNFLSYKKTLALGPMSHRGGKQAAGKELEEIQTREQSKEKEVIQVRLENIKLKNKIKKYEMIMKSKEELAEGLHLIDFEQLKIENQTYNEKIEERNEELLKLRKKITNTVQVLTHLKEKLQFVQAENQVKKAQLMEVEVVVAQKRDVLTKTKLAKDSLRRDNARLRKKCGLLGNRTLLRDFEDKVDAIDELTQGVEVLKRRHVEILLDSHGYAKKIGLARPGPR